MSNLTNALAIVLAINVMMFLGQSAILSMDSEAGTFYNCEGTIIGGFEQSACANSEYLLNDADSASLLPEGAQSVNPETGNIFTDAFSGIKTWLLDSTGLSYLVNILSAPTNFLKMMGLPSAFSFAVGALWYGLTLFLIVGFLFGRDV